MIGWDEEKVAANIRKADTEDLLDRVTAYRPGMEPAAVVLMEAELLRRGVTAAGIAAHREANEREWLFDADGTARMCSRCHQPAVREVMGWHKVFGVVPLFRRQFRFCKTHFHDTGAKPPSELR